MEEGLTREFDCSKLASYVPTATPPTENHPDFSVDLDAVTVVRPQDRAPARTESGRLAHTFRRGASGSGGLEPFENESQPLVALAEPPPPLRRAPAVETDAADGVPVLVDHDAIVESVEAPNVESAPETATRTDAVIGIALGLLLIAVGWFAIANL